MSLPSSTSSPPGRRLTGIESSNSSSDTDTNVGEVLAWSWVIGALALAVTGIIVAAAFATSARRQLVTVGLLSSNGAPERVIRRSLALQGSWTGLAGSVLGVAAGLVGVQALRGRIEQLLGHAVTGHGVAPLDLARHRRHRRRGRVTRRAPARPAPPAACR